MAPLGSPADGSSPSLVSLLLKELHLPAVTPDPAHIWTRLQAEVRHRVSESAYDIWLSPLRWGGIDGDRIVVLAPAQARAWVQQRYASILDEAARTVLGPGSAAALLSRLEIDGWLARDASGRYTLARSWTPTAGPPSTATAR